MKIADLDTPALLIDLDLVEANIQRWQTYCDTHAIRNRPHVKTHKLPTLAWKQVRAGAAGVTCQKLGEAEAMAAAGISDILLPYNIVGPHKLERLQQLHRCCSLSVSADSETVLQGLSTAMRAESHPLPVLIECDTGMRRCGVQTPEEAFQLARITAHLPGLRFAGLLTYPTGPTTAAFFDATVTLCRSTGLDVATLSGGGTPQMWSAHQAAGITEHRAGTYIYHDRMTVAAGAATIDDCALSLLTTVVSRPAPDRAVIDGGSKTFSSDSFGLDGYGAILNYPQATLVRLSEEHGVVDTSALSRAPRIGEQLRIVPNHACVVSNLHNQAYAVRGDTVEAIWPIASRGAVQ
jgi:D-serine deaminase-like pyridoxal phosphate-dependent protein